MKYGLALHTTSSQLGLAISNFDVETRSQVWDLGRELSNILHQHLADFISPQTWTRSPLSPSPKGWQFY